MDRHPRILAEAPLGRHFCQIHEDATALTDAVSDYSRSALRGGHAVVLAAVPARLAEVESRLRKAGIPVDESMRTGQLTMLDAHALLAQVMDGAAPDLQAFRRVIGGVLTDVAGRGHKYTRVYGELVNVLWHADNTDGAIALEDLWNELAFEHRFALFCGYEMGGLDERSYRGPLGEIARCHSDVLETAFDVRLQDALDRASSEVLGLPMSSALCYFGRDRHDAEHRLPAGRRTMLWLHRNMPSAVGKVLARARVHYSAA